ncbi:MAG TPA: AAA family ATPase [Acidimicrobiia bacterium]|nr:AAA family ATPase [Acidimicrobiia bacterium]
MERVWVVGDSGSGKTSMARAIAERLAAPHVELDALFHEPNWTQADDAVFRGRVDEATAGRRWVVDGNYQSRVLDLQTRADTIVWLDYPVRIRWPRVVRRSIRRAVDKQELWNGNREQLSFWVRPDHPIWWTLTHHRTIRREYTAVSDERWLRFRHPRAAERWLRTLARG